MDEDVEEMSASRWPERLCLAGHFVIIGFFVVGHGNWIAKLF